MHDDVILNIIFCHVIDDAAGSKFDLCFFFNVLLLL
jgi:hypothetical protein